MKTPILGSSYVARSVNAADARMVNLFPEIVPEGGKEPAFLNRAPGLRRLATLGSGPIRGMWQLGAYGYVVSGEFFYRIDSNWNAVLKGVVTGSGQVSMADNGRQIFLACNPDGYIYDTNTETLAQITDLDFPGAVSVGYIDGYFVFNEPNSQRIWVSNLLDGTQIDPLSFASAEGAPDNVVGLIVDHREVWVFGTNSVEVWYDAGLVNFPLQRIQGAYNEIGCIAPYSIAKLDNAVFWLGADARGRGIVYRTAGYNGARISTHAVEWQIQQYDDLSDAVAYTYQQDGHAFYVLNFPSADTTWVYDVATQAWHERAAFSDGQFHRHRANCQMSYNNEIVVGDFHDGRIYAFDLTKYSDDDAVQRWLRSWRALSTGKNDLRRTTQHALQLDCETGVGLDGLAPSEAVDFYLVAQNGDFLITESGDYLVGTPETVQGVIPQVMLRWSDDGGHTWSNEHWKTMGRIGRYGTRTIWRRLGMTLKIRDRVYEVSGTDPVKIAIMGAELVVSGTDA